MTKVKEAGQALARAKATATGPNLFQRLIEVKRNVEYLKKDGSGYGFKYTSPSQVLSAINPVLNANGVMLQMEVLDEVHQEIKVETKKGIKVEWLWTLRMRMTWVNIDDPQDRESLEWMGSGCNGQEQGYGSALTYAERYFFLKYFNIPTDEDDPDAFEKRSQTEVSRPHGGRKPAQDPRSHEKDTKPQEWSVKDQELLKESYMSMVMEWIDLFSDDEYKQFSNSGGWSVGEFRAAYRHVFNKIREREPQAEVKAIEDLFPDKAFESNTP